MSDSVKPQPSARTSRRYDSPVRRERALETERRILTAAATAFAQNGYVGTSLEAIANAAGVNPRTVYKVFGTKVRLLSRLVDVSMVGDQDAVPLAGRSWALDAFEAPTGVERVGAFAAAIRRVMESAGAVFRAAAQAAVADPDAAALWRLGQVLRQRDAAAFVAALHDASHLRSDRTPDEAIASVWLLTSPETYLQMTDGLAWSPAQYEQWLRQSMFDLLLGHE
ncbi:MAG: TetR/AcrR family transcriptional regulator [Chloroflexota bacterium]|nr:TetR/AcrR family transcriptional regulator [Chloroflexota bacterium]